MNLEAPSSLKQAGHLRFNAVLAALLWTLLLAASIAWNVYHQRQELLGNARLQAEAYINKDLSFRSWATSHGGVYVRPTEKSPPNPYIKVPDRDVVTTDGMQLTLINPAYMIRQVLQDFSAPFGIRGHLTSLKLMNPDNAPDPWEHEALLAFARGVKEVKKVAELDGKTILRYMRPLYMEPGCLKCHGGMGYKEGDIRGGISTMVDMEPLQAVSAKTVSAILAAHGVVWLVGLLGIGLSARRSMQRAIERERSVEAIRLNEQRALALLALNGKTEELSEREILQEGLEEAERLTSSQIAYLHFVDDDQKTIELVMWSKRTLQHCKAAFDTHYPIAAAGVWADCARTRQPVIHNDYQSLGNKRSYPEGHAHLVRHLSVPVLEGDMVRMIMGVGNKASDYDQDDSRLLQMIANDLWKVVRRRRAEEALRRAKEEMEQHVQERTEALSVANDNLVKSVAELQLHHREMQLINQLNDMLQTCQTLDEAYRVIEITVRELFGVRGGALMIMDSGRHYLETVVRWGETVCEESFAPEDCWAMRQGQRHYVEDVKDALLCKHFTSPPGGGYLCMPFAAQGKIMGSLYLEMKVEDAPKFHEAQASLAETVCEAIKLGLSNISLRIALREQATHDQLTGLYNRRYLNEALPREMHRAMRGHSPLCAVMMDIDHFKNFNDAHGHEAGDLVLREIGRLLLGCLRRSDIACRFGGEEIAIIMPESSLEDAQQRLEQICQQIKQMDLHFGGQTLEQVTVSVGVARMPEHGATLDQLLHTADQALYAAKAAGRDRIVVYKTE